MRVYYHHVGKTGATADFKKTVFTELPLTIVEEHIQFEAQDKTEMLGVLYSKFPDGRFNCWGVPSGANFVVRNLAEGDVVLLVEAITENGAIPALCPVSAFWSIPMPSLSQALWGSNRYPYIFFFKTEELSLTWAEFLEHTDYSPNLNPRGQFMSIADSKLVKWGGPSGYLSHLRINHQSVGGTTYTARQISFNEHPEVEAESRDGTEVEWKNLVSEAEADPPKLTTDEARISKLVTAPARSIAFKIGIRTLYGERCAICGERRVGPDNIPEAQSAHIYPKARNGSDDLRNGICLCRFHHWAFDAGWMSIANDLTILVKENLPEDNAYNLIRRYKGCPIAIPTHHSLAPHPLYLSAHRELHGFE
ncbi:MAG TPA: HNH endonuclease [Aggregatilinea sp.]|uniref:HNH endonuclease n=1 Tax=Aggregatilinea sp. TaxID=2806333 RepID=UPI002D19C35C|nr:HNH endonuclease [Aggregatilinea sp.]HML24390.1 HNH endonuclease [Aggregatilinea sp.]